MRLRTTLLLLILVIALSAAIVGIERFLPTTRELLEMKKGPVRFDRTKITQIEIDSSGGDGVSLSWDGAKWWVRRPFNDLADPEKVAKLLSELSGIGWINRVHQAEFDADGWTRTQFDKPHHTVRLVAGSENILNLSLGAQSPIEGSHYLSIAPLKEGEETVRYVAKTTLPYLLKTIPHDWRDGKLLRLLADYVLNVKLVQAGGQIELARANERAPWMLVKPLSTRGSKERISEMLSTLLNLSITEVAEPVTNTKSPTAVPGSAELTSENIKISVAVKGLAKPFDITLTKPLKDSITTTAQVNYRKSIFTITSKSLAALWSQPNDLRDRMLARIDKEAITTVDVTSTLGQSIHLEKQNQSWFLKRNNRMEPANGERVVKFYEALNNFQIHEFTSDSASNLTVYGLDHPFMTASWAEGAAKPTKLLFGVSKESTGFFAKYENEPSVFLVDATLLPNIPQENIKWKGLGALRFTQFSLRQISLAAGTAPPVVLKYDSTTAQWTGERAGQNITAQIDRVKADKLAGSLAKFNVQDWAGDVTNAISALQSPALRVVVTLGEPGTNMGPTRDTILNFAPTQTGIDTALYFGQVQGDPDVFYIARSALLELLAPVFKSAT